MYGKFQTPFCDPKTIIWIYTNDAGSMRRCAAGSQPTNVPVRLSFSSMLSNKKIYDVFEANYLISSNI